MKINRLIAASALIGSSFLPLSPAKANLLVYEGFEGYINGQNIHNQTVSSFTIGLTGLYAASITDSKGILTQDTGLTFSNLTVSGGSIKQQDASSAVIAGAQFSLGSAVTGDLFASYLINFGTLPSANTARAAYLSVSTSRSSGGTRQLAMAADNNGTTPVNGNAAVGYDGIGTSAADSGKVLPANQTLLVLAHFTNVGLACTTENPGLADMWVLTADQFDYFQGTGFTLENLLAASVGTGAGSVYAYARDTYTGAAINMTSSRYMQVTVSSLSSSAPYTLDEIRYGTSLSDVAPVPEPSTAMLLISAGAMGGLALRRFRSQKQ